MNGLAGALADAGISLRHHRPGSHRAPCPRCDRGPRDSALGISIDCDDGVVWGCFRCGWSGAWRPSGPRPERPANGTHASHSEPSEPATTDDEKRKIARWLWSTRRPISGTPAEKYLRNRGFNGEPPATMGFLPGRNSYPAGLISAFAIPDEPEPGVLRVADDAVMGVHVVRVTDDGQKAPIDPVKQMFGPSLGTPIVIAPMNDLLGLIVCEGIETGLSLYEATGCGVWAAGSAGRMAALAGAVPSYCDCITVACEADPAGMEGARNLIERLQARGLRVEMRTLGGAE